MGRAQAGEAGERRHRVFLEVEKLHLLDAAGEGRRDLGSKIAGLLTGAIRLRHESGHLGMNQSGSFRRVGRDEPEEFFEHRRHRAEVHPADDRRVADAEQIGQLRQTRTLGADPIDFPRIILHRAMFVRVVAVDPDQVAAADLMRPSRDAGPTLAAQAEDEFMSGEVVALDVMLRAGEQMACAGHRIEHLLVRRIRGRVERDREAIGDGGLSHGRIIQPAGRGMPFKTASIGVE